MAKRVIQTADAPAAIGPYSQAVVVGDALYTSGQIALDPATGELIVGDVRAQATQVMRNLHAVEFDDTGGRIVETQQKMKDRTLTRSGRADDGKLFALAHRKAYAA